MALNLYISNDIEKLASKLANNIKLQPLELFQKEHIVVQTEGMSSWISVNVSQNNSIFANFEFHSPNKLLFELFRLAGIYNSGLYDTNNLKWIIYKIIGSDEFKSRFYNTYLYFEKDKTKQLQLAAQLSDIYDQYVIYRPDYIRLWNEDKSPVIKNFLSTHEKWQKWIWLKIKEQLGKKSYDKVEMRDRLLDKFKDRDFVNKVKNKFPRISLFGFSIFTLFHVEVFLSELKDIVDINFYLTNPSPEDFWFKDIKEKTKIKIEKKTNTSADELKLVIGNQLLMNQGKTAKDLFNMLFDIDEVFNVMDNESFVKPPEKNSLLQIIQNEVYYNIPNRNREVITENIINDGSIQIVSNYTQVREVETLYNYILKQIQENNFKLNDIIVQTTNIDLYTPIIKAVFDNADVRIPYIIADRSYAGNDNLISVLKHLLSLQKDEFTSEDILQLLDFGVIRKKFDISNINILRTLIKESNIRHGIEGKDENDTRYVSWKYGLERVLLGYAIKSDSFYNSTTGEYEIKPLGISEGDYAKEGLKLKSFVDTLIYYINNRYKSRNLSEWRDYIFDYINSTLEVTDDKINELNYIFDKLSFSDTILSILDEKITFEVFSKAFIDSLYANNRSGKFISGSITFCSMIPMRSIPYKVIAILGLNTKVFPRVASDISFDLIQYEYRKGDRNLKETDKYLFFETLLSAKEKLFLSYLGLSIKDNTDLPPSVVIEELIDYIAVKSSIDLKESKLLIKHPLDNYNKKYYDDSCPEYYTFLKYGNNRSINNSLQNRDEIVIEEKFVKLDDLQKFITNPIKWYFNKTLNINYYEDSILLPETEVFELNHLEKYLLKNEIITNPNIDLSIHNLNEKIIEGVLPLKNMGRFEVDNTYKELSIIAETYKNIVGDSKPESIDFEYILGNDYSIHGKVEEIYDKRVILLDISSNYYKSFAKLRLLSWICSSCELPVEKLTLLYLKKGKNDLKEKTINLPNKKDAVEDLNKIIELYILVNKEIVPFYPMSSYEYLRKHIGKSKKVGSPYQVFLNVLNSKKEFDQYIDKALELGVYKKYENDDNTILDLAKLFFDEIIL